MSIDEHIQNPTIMDFGVHMPYCQHRNRDEVSCSSKFNIWVTLLLVSGIVEEQSV